MSKICTFFGHRDAPEHIFATLQQQIEILINQGFDTFWCGGKGNFDAMAAQAIRGFKLKYPAIKLCLILERLPTSKTKNFKKLVRQYDELIFPEGVELVPPRFAIIRRNQIMAKNADFVIFYVHRNYGGAFTILQTVKQRGKNFMLLPINSN